MILTIGHSTHPLDEFIAMLRAHGVTRLVDIRRFPGSRRQPQFNKEALASALAGASIAYEHEVGLGGRRDPVPDSLNRGLRNAQFRGYADHMATPEFRSAVERLLEHAREDVLAVMCAEAVPWRCHRSLLADQLTALGQPVEHILSATHRIAHRLTAAARLDGPTVTYPGPDEQPPLPIS